MRLIKHFGNKKRRLYLFGFAIIWNEQRVEMLRPEREDFIGIFWPQYVADGVMPRGLTWRRYQKPAVIERRIDPDDFELPKTNEVYRNR